MKPVEKRRPGSAGGAADEAAADAAAEAAADMTRRSLRSIGPVPIEPDEPVAVMLAPGERVLAARRAARVEPLSGDAGRPQSGVGDLYLTNSRLIHVAEPGLDLQLEDIREAGVVEHQLLLLIGRSGGVLIGVEDPRVLRVEIGAARTALRRDGVGVPPRQSGSR